jgi:hypothetical protein
MLSFRWWQAAGSDVPDASWARMQPELAISRIDCERAVGAALNWAGPAWLALLVGACLRHLVQSRWPAHTEQQLPRAARAARACRAVHAACACMAVLVFVCASAVPLRAIAPSLRLPPLAAEVHAALSSRHLVSGYGLFRRMTGVGRWRPADLLEVEAYGWGGLDPAVVARPELVVEVSLDGQSTWQEVEFKYKPTDPFRRPPFVAPHQPRLDWQMWFAALSSAQHNPWL